MSKQGEVRIVSEKEPHQLTIKGGKPIEQTERKGVEIVGGSPLQKPGQVQTLDQHSPVEPVPVQEVIHPDRASFKKAVEKDQ